MDPDNKEAIFAQLQADPYNQVCCDCGQAAPQWASVNNGVFICFNCSGIHRTFGMQISFVRSLTMDSWTAKQLLLMQNGGNAKFREFMSNYGLDNVSPGTKYRTKAAEYYRRTVGYFLKGKAGNEEIQTTPKNS